MSDDGAKSLVEAPNETPFHFNYFDCLDRHIDGVAYHSPSRTYHFSTSACWMADQ